MDAGIGAWDVCARLRHEPSFVANVNNKRITVWWSNRIIGLGKEAGMAGRYRLHSFPASGNSYQIAQMLTLREQPFELMWAYFLEE